MSKRCSVCVHWEPLETSRVDPHDPVVKNKLGLCSKIVSRRRFEGMDDPSSESHEPGETLALVEDLSDECHLRTSPDFSCSLWDGGAT